VVWDVKLNSPVSGGLALFNDVLFFGNSKGELVAFDIKNEKESWRAQLSSEILSSPVVEQGIIVVKTIDGHIYGLNVKTGTQNWTYQTIVPRLTLRGNSSAVIYDGIVIKNCA